MQNLRHLNVGILFFLFSLFISAVYAAPKSAPKITVNLYQTPQKTKVLEKLSPIAPLIPIYHQKDWVKVGDPSNGQVGWVNRDEYRKARNAYEQPNIQTIFIHSTYSKNNKPTIQVVAYENGKALSKKEAEELYQRLKQQQVKESFFLSHTFHALDAWMDQDIREMNRQWTRELFAEQP